MPESVWVPGIKCRSSGLVATPFTHSLSHLTAPRTFCEGAVHAVPVAYVLAMAELILTESQSRGFLEGVYPFLVSITQKYDPMVPHSTDGTARVKVAAQHRTTSDRNWGLRGCSRESVLRDKGVFTLFYNSVRKASILMPSNAPDSGTGTVRQPGLTLRFCHPILLPRKDAGKLVKQ